MLKRFLKFLMFIFSIFSIITSIIMSQSSLLFASLLNDYKNTIQTENYLRLMAAENYYFHQSLIDEKHFFFNNALKVATNINLKDVRSLIFHEIPGLFSVASEIVVAGEGTDFTNLPIESSPPLDEILKEREIAKDSLESIEKNEKEEKKLLEKPKKNTIFIFHTHNRESFIPHLKDSKNAQSAQHKDINITLVGKRFGEKLMEKGIGTVVDTRDIAQIIHDKSWEYWQSYDASREVVKEAMAKNKDFVYFFDIHRDSAKRKSTTTTINGKNYAKLFFVLGQGHPNYKKNEEFAIKFNNLIKKKYPSLTRGIVKKPKTSGSNGVYNQDLAPNSILIEIGGIENNLEELYNTVDLLAELFAEYYWQDAQEVNG